MFPVYIIDIHSSFVIGRILKRSLISDNNGPYYWHIKSGIIQREPPSYDIEETNQQLKHIDTVKKNLLILWEESSVITAILFRCFISGPNSFERMEKKSHIEIPSKNSYLNTSNSDPISVQNICCVGVGNEDTHCFEIFRRSFPTFRLWRTIGFRRWWYEVKPPWK